MELVEQNETVNPGRPSNNLFNENLEKSLIPGITERLEAENKAEYTEVDIKNILGVNCSTENLYQQLKTKLLNTEIGVSIKRIPKNNKFVFFRRFDNVKRESDIFKINFGEFKPELINHLNNNTRLGVEENWLKKRLGCLEYSTENLYRRCKDGLSNTDMNVSLEKNMTNENGKKVNGFVFYNEKMLEKEKIEEDKRKEREKHEEIEREMKIKNEIENENEEAKKFAAELAKDGNLISDILDDMIKNPVETNNTGIISDILDDMKKDKEKDKEKNEVVQCPFCKSKLFYENDEASNNNNEVLNEVLTCPYCGESSVYEK